MEVLIDELGIERHEQRQDAIKAIEAFLKYREGRPTSDIWMYCTFLALAGWPEYAYDEYYGSYAVDGSLSPLGLKVRMAAEVAQHGP